MAARLLIVGFGSIGALHARVIRRVVPDAKLAVLRHRSCGEMAGTGFNRCVTTIEEALAFKPQVAVIANPASHHIEVARRLADAGVHLLVEKPLSSSANGVSELIDLCEGRGVALMTGYNLRFWPSLQRFRALLHEERIGSVLSVRAEVGQFLPSWRPGSDYRRTVSAQAALGGGVLLELSHEIDYLRWIFGEVEWINAVHRKQSRLEIDVEDTAHVILGFAPRMGAAPLVGVLSMDFIRHDTSRNCTAIGELGSLRWNALAGTVEVFEAGASHWESLFAPRQESDDCYESEWRHFLACIADASSPSASGHDGLAVLRIIDAIRRSSESGSLAAVEPAAGRGGTQ